MFDFFGKFGEIIFNIFGFFRDCITGITGFIDSLQSWWESAMVIISVFPRSMVVIVVAAFGLLAVFILVELLRDFL